MTPAPLVRGSAYIPFVEFMERLGAPIERRLGTSLLPAFVQKDPEALVPVHLAHAYLHRSAESVGLPDFGFVVGETAKIEHLGAFGRCMLRSLTLHQALEKCRSAFALYSSAEHLWWSRTGDNVLLCHAYGQPTGPGSQYAQQCALLLMRDLVRLAAGETWQPRHVFVPSRMEPSALRAAFDDVKIERARFCGFLFPAKFLSLPFARFSDECDVKDFGAFVPAGDFVGSIRQVVSLLMAHGRCHIGDVADAIGMHPRTLQRRLADAEFEYSDLLADVRFEASLRFLNDPRLRVIDIAYELGYSDPTNFSRAFQQWTGMSPTNFRRAREAR